MADGLTYEQAKEAVDRLAETWFQAFLGRISPGAVPAPALLKYMRLAHHAGFCAAILSSMGELPPAQEGAP